MLNTISAKRIIYLLQEDERMSYGMGDDHLPYSRTPAEPVPMTVINTELLRRHMTEGEDAVPALSERALAFEPAFRDGQRMQEPVNGDGKRTLFFHARPHDPRNVFATGPELIETAVMRGILDPERWRVHLVGHDVGEMRFPAIGRPCAMRRCHGPTTRHS